MLKLKNTLLIASLVILGNKSLVAGERLSVTIAMASMMQNINKLSQLTISSNNQVTIFVAPAPETRSPIKLDKSQRTKKRAYNKHLSAARQNFKTHN